MEDSEQGEFLKINKPIRIQNNHRFNLFRKTS